MHNFKRNVVISWPLLVILPFYEWWWLVNIGPGFALKPLGNESVPGPKLTKIYVATWCHQATMGLLRMSNCVSILMKITDSFVLKMYHRHPSQPIRATISQSNRDIICRLRWLSTRNAFNRELIWDNIKRRSIFIDIKGQSKGSAVTTLYLILCYIIHYTIYIYVYIICINLVIINIQSDLYWYSWCKSTSDVWFVVKFV